MVMMKLSVSKAGLLLKDFRKGMLLIMRKFFPSCTFVVNPYLACFCSREEATCPPDGCLNGELKEEIYMKQPPGYVQSGKEELVCRLRKSIYGLKQSPRCWNEKLCSHLKSLGFKESGADSCVFIQSGKKDLKIIAVYVDDLILIAKSLGEIQQMKDSLSKSFKMKYMGQLHYCLGIN